MRSLRPQLTASVHNTHSLYSAGQCLFSIMGILGLMLIFAGIPDYVDGKYPLKSWSMTAFVAGAFMIVTMLVGNFLVAQRYHKAIERLERHETEARIITRSNDKPPSYDDLLKSEESPPTYASLVTLKPPRYEDTVIVNWQSELSCSQSQEKTEFKDKDECLDKRKDPSSSAEAPLSPSHLLANASYIHIDMPSENAQSSQENHEDISEETYQTHC